MHSSVTKSDDSQLLSQHFDCVDHFYIGNILGMDVASSSSLKDLNFDGL